MSLFGSTANTGGLFGGGTKPAGSIFGQSTQQQPSTGLFGQSSNQNAQSQQQSTGLFGQSTQNNQQPQQQQQQQQQQTSIFGGNAQGGGLGLFGGNTNTSQNQSSGLFGASTQQNQTQQQTGGLFGQSQQTTNSMPQLGQSLGQSLYQPVQQRDTSVVGQMEKIKEKWDPSHPECAFRHWFYNKVDENQAPYYQPQQREDPKQWEEALSKKPGPGYIPVLCVGFSEMGERIKLQQRYLGTFNQRLHEINNSLEAMLSKHDLEISVRALDSRRKHTVLKQRVMALATRVQILKNRGYALGGDEEELKAKLQALERGVIDPGLQARTEEIWARMVGVRERARILKDEMNKRANETGPVIDDEIAKRAERILEDYAKQLGHLKRELTLVSQDLKEWEKDQPSQTNIR